MSGSTNQPTFVKSFDEYLEITRVQCKKHGRKALSPKDFTDTKAWKFAVGFESPDGWFVIDMRTLKQSFLTNQWHESEIVLPSGMKIKKCSRVMPEDKMMAEFKKRLEEAMAS